MLGLWCSLSHWTGFLLQNLCCCSKFFASSKGRTFSDKSNRLLLMVNFFLTKSLWLFFNCSPLIVVYPTISFKLRFISFLSLHEVTAIPREDVVGCKKDTQSQPALKILWRSFSRINKRHNSSLWTEPLWKPLTHAGAWWCTSVLTEPAVRDQEARGKPRLCLACWYPVGPSLLKDSEADTSIYSLYESLAKKLII